MDGKIRTEVDINHFGEKVKIEKKLRNFKERYVYQVSHKGHPYILKGFRIQLAYLDPNDKTSVESFKKSLIEINEIFREYYFARTVNLFNRHIAAPLALDFKIEVTKDKVPASFIYIEIIFEYEGEALSSLKPITLKLTYNLMRQSANALFILHNLGINNFDIKPDSMVYNRKTDLLKIIDMGSAFGSSNRKKLEDATVKIGRKSRSTTPKFAPPEVSSKKEDLKENQNMELSLPATDIHYWAMCFFDILTERKSPELSKNYKKHTTEPKYKEFIKAVAFSFDKVKAEDSKEEDLKKMISGLIIEALKYRPEERPMMKNVIEKMKEFEHKNSYVIEYSKVELEYSKNVLKLLMADNKIDDTFNENKVKEEKVEPKVEDKKDIKSKDQINKEETKGKNEKIRMKKEDIEKEDTVLENQAVSKEEIVKLECGHKVNKDCLIRYALYLFSYKESYGFNYKCENCRMTVKLKSLPLSCGCMWEKFGEEIEFNNDLSKAEYGKCSKAHPLTPIDLGLLNDFISVNLTSLMISYSPKEELLDLFNEVVKKESIKDIAWILRYAKIFTNLDLRCKRIGDEDAKVISEALRINTTLTKLDLSGNKIEDEGGKAIGEALKINTTLTELNLSYNNIEDEGAKVIGKALRTNSTLTNIEDEDVKVIGKTLGTNPMLKNIEDEGTKVIGKALGTNSTLTKLDLSYNKIKHEGAKAISEALRTNKTLTELNLCSNNIRCASAKVIGEALTV